MDFLQHIHVIQKNKNRKLGKNIGNKQNIFFKQLKVFKITVWKSSSFFLPKKQQPRHPRRISEFFPRLGRR